MEESEVTGDRRSEEDERGGDDRCAVCLGPYEAPFVAISCGHSFCYPCMLGAFKNSSSSCPVCKTPCDGIVPARFCQGSALTPENLELCGPAPTAYTPIATVLEGLRSRRMGESGEARRSGRSVRPPGYLEDFYDQPRTRRGTRAGGNNSTDTRGRRSTDEAGTVARETHSADTGDESINGQTNARAVVTDDLPVVIEDNSDPSSSLEELPDIPSPRRRDDDEAGLNEVAVVPRNRNYFRGSSRLPGTEITNREAIVSAVLRFMIERQLPLNSLSGHYMGITRDIIDAEPEFFGGQETKVASKRVQSNLKKAIKDYRNKIMVERGSGITGPPLNSLERKISEILALDRSLSMNDESQHSDVSSIFLRDPALGRHIQRSPSPVPRPAVNSNGVVHRSSDNVSEGRGIADDQRVVGGAGDQRPSLVVEQREAEEAVAELGLDSPILPASAENKRMRQAHGRETRESSLSIVRKSRNSNPRMESILSAVAVNASQNKVERSSMQEFLMVSTQERQMEREHRMALEKIEMEKLREEKREEKEEKRQQLRIEREEQNRRRAIEERNNMIMMSMMARFVPGGGLLPTPAALGAAPYPEPAPSMGAENLVTTTARCFRHI